MFISLRTYVHLYARTQRNCLNHTYKNTVTELYKFVRYISEAKGKNRTQKIIIHYRFIGVIENPVKEENIVLEARQGVAVEYLTA